MREAKRRLNRVRRREFLKKAAKWWIEEYEALKIAARLQHVELPWSEYEALPLRDRYNKRKLVALWIDVTAAGLELDCWSKWHQTYFLRPVPTRWLQSHYTPALQEALKGTP